MQFRMSQAVMFRYILGALLAVVCINLVLLPAGLAHPMSRSRRASSYRDIECRGVFNKSVYTRLNTICQDCFELYKEPELHGLCRHDCFGSDYFRGCVQALQRTDQEAEFSRWIQSLRGNSFD